MSKFRKFRHKLNLQLFADEVAVDPGVESAPAAEVQTQETEVSQTGVETQAAAEPEKQNNFEKAFAKRLAAEREKWQAEIEDKYKHYEDYRKAAEYLQKTSGINDIMTLKERIELEELQEQAEQQSVPVEVLKRIQELEAKAAKAEQLEKAQQEEQRVAAYWSSINEFVKDKGIEAEKLNQFMIDNGLSYDPNDPAKSFTIAYKAMRADELEQKLAMAEKEGMKKLLQAKGSIPTVPGNNASGQVSSPTPKTFAEARQRAMQRFAE